MKKISKKHFPKRYLLSAGIAILIVAGGSLAYFKIASPSQNKNISDTTKNDSETPKTNNNPATSEQQNAGSNQKQDIVDRDQQSTPPSSSLTVTITAANQNASAVNIRSLVNTVSSDGICTLTITSGSSKTTKTSGLQALAESSTCQGFDVPASNLPKGTWHIVLSITAGNAKGSAQKDIVVN